MHPRRRVVWFRNDLDGSEMMFSRPREIVMSDRPETFAAALDDVERARRAGRWLAGYISYEAGYLLDPALRRDMPEGRSAPLMCLGVFDGPDERAPVDILPSTGGEAFLAGARATWSFERYRKRFVRLHRHLRGGDCYQANLTFPVVANWGGDPVGLFLALQQRQPVRHSAFIDLEGPLVLSRSPELFFGVTRDRWIETLPMKGTAPRGGTREEDEALRQFLRGDPKNQAENRMIVDLLRNDISRIGEVGTLDVPELFTVESYPTVHQMVSRVRARLREGMEFRDILAALFPCGSITGAPKISAMHILRQLEDGPRDVYCGAIGFISPDGTMRFSVAIRTISLFPDGRAVFNVGGGVVSDSTAQGEYDECLLKGRFATGEAPTFI